VVAAKTKPLWLFDGSATSDAIDRLVHAKSDKALVISCISQLVAEGYAKWIMLDDGDIGLSLPTGETFLLAERVVIRLA
jgi:hypothetical protein